MNKKSSIVKTEILVSSFGSIIDIIQSILLMALWACKRRFWASIRLVIAYLLRSVIWRSHNISIASLIISNLLLLLLLLICSKLTIIIPLLGILLACWCLVNILFFTTKCKSSIYEKICLENIVKNKFTARMNS